MERQVGWIVGLDSGRCVGWIQDVEQQIAMFDSDHDGHIAAWIDRAPLWGLLSQLLSGMDESCVNSIVAKQYILGRRRHQTVFNLTAFLRADQFNYAITRTY